MVLTFKRAIGKLNRFHRGILEKTERILSFLAPPGFRLPEGVERRTGYLGVPTRRVLSIFQVLGALRAVTGP